jgi:hypothetical protein
MLPVIKRKMVGALFNLCHYISECYARHFHQTLETLTDKIMFEISVSAIS